jgi:uncharacterized protein YbbC (DUF1343 family)
MSCINEIIQIDKSRDNAKVDKANFFNAFFNKLAGNDLLMQQIKDGKTEKEIRASWAAGVENYKVKRKAYLLYP